MNKLVNSANILLLADFIEQHKEQPFDLGSPWPAGHPCGTACCIAGFGAMLWPETLPLSEAELVGQGRSIFSHLSEKVAANLGLDDEQQTLLFAPGDVDNFFEEDCEDDDYYNPIQYEEITRAGAITTLHRLAETGEVIWRRDEQG